LEENAAHVGVNESGTYSHCCILKGRLILQERLEGNMMTSAAPTGADRTILSST
jgi:hypothetical protein